MPNGKGRIWGDCIGVVEYGVRVLDDDTLDDSIPYGSARHKLNAVAIPNTVTTIGRGAFYGHNLTSVVIPQSVTTIGAEAFYKNPLTSVTLPANVKLNSDGSNYSWLILSSFSLEFDAYYTKNDKKAGTYTCTRTRKNVQAGGRYYEEKETWSFTP
ncbi:leucine-rich repeat domain-containing protein [Breznakiellaceae bacterium SP9]